MEEESDAERQSKAERIKKNVKKNKRREEKSKGGSQVQRKTTREKEKN